MDQDNEIEAEEPIVKSEHDDVVSFVYFQSRIKRPVELLWVNYEGKVVSYIIMNYLESYRVDTYVTHPWIVWDAETQQRYLLNGQPVHFPAPWDPNDPVKLVTLDIPVFSLKECGLQAVRGWINENKLDQLEIPRTLLHDLRNPPSPGFQYEERDGE